MLASLCFDLILQSPRSQYCVFAGPTEGERVDDRHNKLTAMGLESVRITSDESFRVRDIAYFED